MKGIRLIPVEKAHALIARRCKRVEFERMPLARASGRVLREPLRADRPIPPFHRAAMDGFAVRAADFVDGKAELIEVANIPAGAEWHGRLAKGQCARIMTGAPVPKGADAVVKVEYTKARGPVVCMHDPTIGPNLNVHPRGADARCGAVLLRAGAALGQGEIAVAASIGAFNVAVSRRVVVGVLSTGKEVVKPSGIPTPFQIRDANRPTLLATLSAMPWCKGQSLGIAPDSEQALRRLIHKAMSRCDVLLVSGGVSVGDYDLVPDALRRLGVRKVFHGVAIRPGKPLWFGASGHGTLVFGLPGNPVSVRVGFREFVTPALRRMAGFAVPLPAGLMLPLAEPFKKKHSMTAFALGRVVNEPRGSRVCPVPHEGSGDFVSAAASDGVFIVPADVKAKAAGDVVEFHPWQAI